jgi:hypothetical protein
MRKPSTLTSSVLAILLLAISAVGLPAQNAAADDVERRIAEFWKRVDAQGPSDLLTAADLGGWALNVIERDPGAGITVADFRAQAEGMQAGFDRAGTGIPPGAPLSSDVEGRIALFWQRVDALGAAGLLTAADLGQWAINVIERDPNKRIRVGDFRVSTAGMQGGFDRARTLPRPATPIPTPTRAPTATATPTATPAATPTPTPASRAQAYSYRVRQEVARGGTGTCEVGFTNTGETTWTNGSATQLFVRATRTDQGASRAFVPEGADVGTQVEGAVAPGQVGHVRFTVSVPVTASPLTHILYVVAVLGGKVISAEGIGCYFTITTAIATATPIPTPTPAPTTPTPPPPPAAPSYPPGLRAELYSFLARQDIAQGSSATCDVAFVNVGTISWTRDTTMQLYVRAVRTDPISTVAFVPGGDLGTQAQSFVGPGQTGNVRFTLTVPANASLGTYSLYVVPTVGGSAIGPEGIGCYFAVVAPSPTTPAPAGAGPAATCSARADARVYKTAFVPIVPAGVSAAEQSALMNVVTRLRDIFPAFWTSATDCRSTMQITGPELLVDTAGTLLPSTDGPDIDNARAAFLQTHANTFDLVMFFPLQEESKFDWWRRVGLSTARAAPTGQLQGHGRVYIRRSSVATTQAENYIPVMLHEFHHQWCCYVTTPSGYGLASDYLAPASAGGHWSAWINFPSRPKYTIIAPAANGWGWTANADGTYTLDCGWPSPIAPSTFGYPKFALWLMGILPRTDVPALEVLVGTTTDPADPTDRCTGAPSVTFSGLTKVTLPISAIVGANSYFATGP